MSLEMKPTCKTCVAALAPDAPAFICSHECTYCPSCAAGGVCPTCHGELSPRPRRRAPGAAPIAAPVPALLATPDPPYVAVIFSSVRTAGDNGYGAAVAEMNALAAVQPGYRGIESARNPDGFGLSVSYWQSRAEARAWGEAAAHRAVQVEARARWYHAYNTRIAEVGHAYGFVRR